MKSHDVAKYARKLRLAIEERDAATLERDDWAARFRELGFEMDCGHSYEELYGLALYDTQGLRRELERIDDVLALGNAIFSYCRYITHWSTGPCERELDWLEIALGRLEELAHNAWLSISSLGDIGTGLLRVCAPLIEW